MGKPNIQNLIPINTRTKEEQRKIARKGGLVRSEAKKRASKIRELKRKGISNKDASWMVKIIEDPSMTDVELVELYNKLKKEANPQQMFQLFQAAVQLKKAVHGDKTPQVAIQQNIGDKIEINIIEHGSTKESKDKPDTVIETTASVQDSE